jgi:hypothetical protein
MITKRLLAFAAFGMFMAGSALAAPPPPPPPVFMPPVAADLSVGAGWLNSTCNWGCYDQGMVSGLVRAATPISGNLMFEAELNAESFFNDGESDTAFAAVGHFYTGAPNYAAGLFGGFTSIYGYSGYVLGGEANYYMPMSTFFAQVAYWNGSDYDASILQGRIGGHYYFTPDTKATLDVSYYANDIDNVWRAEGILTHRFTGTNWAGFASITYAADDADCDPFKDWTFKVGFQLFLDPPGTTLQGHDHAVPFDVKLPWIIPYDYEISG